jgi:hypothetical protein
MKKYIMFGVKTGISEIDIYSRQGHDSVISLKHIDHYLLLNKNFRKFSNYIIFG